MPLNGRTKKDVVAEFRHAEILEAARRVFADKGFSQASVDDIAQAAGVAKGTLYLYYPSKRDIYWEALKHGLIDLERELERRVGAAAGIEEKIRAFLITKLNYFEAHRDFFRIYYAEFGHVFAEAAYLQADIKKFHFRQVQLLASAIEKGVRRKAIRNMPAEATASAIVNLTRGVITQRLLGWATTSTEEDIAFMFDLTWKGLAGR